MLNRREFLLATGAAVALPASALAQGDADAKLDAQNMGTGATLT
jgi:hypothetical protein